MSADDGRVRYPAFLSYSHRDAGFARRLHRRLETYALPRRLVGRVGPRGPVPARLTPIFRDREELSAAGDLSAEVRAALAASGALVVVCTPAAAASPWVAREVETFRSLHPDRPVLAVLAQGEPAEAFPPPLLADGAEPLAADFRSGQDGAALGFLKLVSGIAGVGLDELIQRDAQRRLRVVTAVTAGAVAVMLAMGALAVVAFQARAEAERRRADAEGLVEFMLTDLRGKLKGVGRLDIMGAVNERALKHYGDQDLARLSRDELTRRAKLLQAMGEDDDNLGHADRALAEFQEAHRTTAALLAQDPNDPERIFAHAQSEFWLAANALGSGKRDVARRGFEAYRRLAGRLVDLAPRNPDYVREVAYAEGNLCSMAFQPPQDVKAAVSHCAAGLRTMQQVAARLPGSADVRADVINRHAWLADAYRIVGDLAKAREQRLIEERLLAAEIAADPKNMSLKADWVALQRAFAALEAAAGRPAEARARRLRALAMLREMTAFDPQNAEWARQKASLTRDLSDES